MKIYTSSAHISSILSVGALVLVTALGIGGCSPRVIREDGGPVPSEPVSVGEVIPEPPPLVEGDDRVHESAAERYDDVEASRVSVPTLEVVEEEIVEEAPAVPPPVVARKTSGKPAAVSPEEVLKDARVHALIGLKSYQLGDLTRSKEELDVALETLLAAELPQGEQGLVLIQQGLPEVYQETPLTKIYAEVSETTQASEVSRIPSDEPEEVAPTRVQVTPEILNQADPPLARSDSEYVHQEIQRISGVFGEKEVAKHETFQSEVEHFIRYYQTEKRGFFERSLARSIKYMPMVEQVFAEKNVPIEMAYIAFVESGFRPVTTSTAGAQGLWQFMPRTARAYGLRVDAQVDDRNDPYKATIAAREYFLDLVAIFGSSSYLLVMASYNAGEGRVQGCLKQVEDPFTQRTFWDIAPCLKQETREYIPRIIAAAIMAKDPERFGFKWYGSIPTPDFEMADIGSPTSLSLISSWIDISVKELLILNPDLNATDTTTPKNIPGYRLIVPVGKKSIIEQNLTEMVAKADKSSKTGDGQVSSDNPTPSPKEPKKEPTPPTTRGDDNPDDITPTPASTKAAKTPPKETRVEPAKVEKAPVRVEEDEDGASEVKKSPQQPASDGRNKYIKYKVQSGNSLSQIAADFGKTEAKIRSWNPYLKNREPKAGDLVYVYELDWSYQRHEVKVKKGDTLGEIAARYDVPVDQVARWNGIKGTTVQVGQTLVIYSHDGNHEVVQVSTGQTPSSTPKASSKASTTKNFTYVVQKGNNLTQIAGYFGVSVGDLVKWNQLKSKEIQAGQRLTVYPDSPVKVTEHTIKSGETLASISVKYNVKLSFLAECNGLSRTAELRAGDTLMVYIP